MIPFNSKLTKADIDLINSFLGNATDSSEPAHASAEIPLRIIGDYQVKISVHLVDEDYDYDDIPF